MRRGLESLIGQLATLPTESGKPKELVLTTNGSPLAAKARSLRDAGLGRVTVSLDALDAATFRQMSDVDVPVSRVRDGIEAARGVGLGPIKVDAVIERGANESEILRLVRMRSRLAGAAVPSDGRCYDASASKVSHRVT